MAEFVKVAATGDIPEGEGRCFDVGDQQVAIFNVEGTYYALDNVCPHQGGPLGEGELDGKMVTCPWHAWDFDVTTGENSEDPDEKQAVFAVKVNGDDVLVKV